ncbi:MAG: EAL domain-containing protein [Myxococcota bacterium]
MSANVSRIACALQDVLARIGGDEFSVILRDIDIDRAKAVAEEFRVILQDYLFLHNGRMFDVTGSIGLAMFDNSTSSPDEVLANADIACHIAKNRGRNVVHLYQPSDEDKKTMDIELGWFARLQYALELDRFKILYQPIWQLSDVQKNGEAQASGAEHYELLIRFVNDDGDLIVPSVFLPIAERFGLIHAVDRWVIRHAVPILASERKRGRNIQFSINLSGKAFDDEGLLEFIEDALLKSELDPAALTFEITESAAITSLENARRFIRNLKQLGCRFALDDFGIGFSSFAHLKFLPVDIVKIDGAFIRDMGTNAVDCALVRAMNDVAHVLGKETVAEFVENEQIIEKLREIQIDYVQGYYVGRPVMLLPGTNPTEANESALDEPIDIEELAELSGLQEYEA